MPQTVTLDELPDALERIWLTAIRELDRAGHVETATELGSHLATKQRRRTGRAQRSTTATGKRWIPYDPGPSPNDQLDFFPPASRTEIRQSAESTIPKDPPGSKSHVGQAAGEYPEAKPYAGYLEPRFQAGQRSIDATERANPRVAARADRRAERAIRAKGIL